VNSPPEMIPGSTDRITVDVVVSTLMLYTRRPSGAPSIVTFSRETTSPVWSPMEESTQLTLVNEAVIGRTAWPQVKSL